MNKEKLSTYAPMVTETELIRKNSMKLYSYLLCISGLANYPANTRVFQHKNLSLTKIKQATGITDKTAKLYLYMLEDMKLIEYQGTIRQKWIDESDFTNHSDYKKAMEKAAFETWTRRRREEKDQYYRIPRPEPYTPIPELTLDKLNTIFQATEQETKLYITCCRYRDICYEMGRSFKYLTFETLREILGLKKCSTTNSTIRKNLLFLKGIGLIDFQEGQFFNEKGAAVPCFKLTEVWYYVNYSAENIKETDTDAAEVIERLKKIMEQE